MPSKEQPAFTVHHETDESVLAEAKLLDERYRKNAQWFDAHATEIYRNYRGKVLCVAGQELFVADTPAEAYSLARAAHPEDDGVYSRIIPLEKAARIYAH